MHVFLVESPLQLLNAREAKHFFRLEASECIMVIFEGVSKKNFDQIKSIVDTYSWSEIYFFRNNHHPLLRYMLLRKLHSLIQQYKPIESIFVGEYRSDLMRDFVHRSGGGGGNTYLLDDGNASLVIKDLIDSKAGYRRELTGRRRFLNRLFGLNDEDLFRIKFFTIYGEESSPQVIRNEYSFVKEQLVFFEQTDRIFFIGNNTPELGIIEEEVYLDGLIKIKKRYPGKEITYIPHRRENSVKLDKIKQKLNFEIVDADLPIELAIIQWGILPKEIVSFYSSALDNCYTILGERVVIKAFKVDASLISTDRRKHYELNFAQYARYGDTFQVIEL